MNPKKFLLTLAIVSLFTGAAVFAADEKKEEHAAKPARCCAKAAAAGEKCGHECCAEAAKAGDNCAQCKGSGKIADNPPATEHEHKK